MVEYISPDYETISVLEKRQILELLQTGLLNAFNQQDFQDVVAVFDRVCNRLILQAEQEDTP